MPKESLGLCDVHSKEFDKLYTKYEKEGKGRKSIKARELWEKILEAQIETGNPYMLYKDARLILQIILLKNPLINSLKNTSIN